MPDLLTARDIESKYFSRAMRGYAVSEVDEFLDRVAEDIQEYSLRCAELERRIAPHLRAYVDALRLDMHGRELAMTDCWINIMPPRVAHSQHIHPLSTISGTYSVRTPRGCAGLKFEDPRLDRFMAAPPRRADAPPQQRPWVTVPAAAGKLVLFESWLRHEVPPNPVRSERISVSFNYAWF